MAKVKLNIEQASTVRSEINSLKGDIDSLLNSINGSVDTISRYAREVTVYRTRYYDKTSVVNGETVITRASYRYPTYPYTSYVDAYNNAISGMNSKASSMKVIFDVKVNKVINAIEKVLQLVETFENQQGLTLSKHLGTAEHDFSFLNGYGTGKYSGLRTPSVYEGSVSGKVDITEFNNDFGNYKLPTPVKGDDYELVDYDNDGVITINDYIKNQMSQYADEEGKVVIDGVELGNLVDIDYATLSASRDELENVLDDIEDKLEDQYDLKVDFEEKFEEDGYSPFEEKDDSVSGGDVRPGVPEISPEKPDVNEPDEYDTYIDFLEDLEQKGAYIDDDGKFVLPSGIQNLPDGSYVDENGNIVIDPSLLNGSELPEGAIQTDDGKIIIETDYKNLPAGSYIENGNIVFAATEDDNHVLDSSPTVPEDLENVVPPIEESTTPVTTPVTDVPTEAPTEATITSGTSTEVTVSELVSTPVYSAGASASSGSGSGNGGSAGNNGGSAPVNSEPAPTTQPATQAPTQPATQPATQAPTQPATQPATQAPTQPATQPKTEPKPVVDKEISEDKVGEDVPKFEEQVKDKVEDDKTTSGAGFLGAAGLGAGTLLSGGNSPAVPNVPSVDLPVANASPVNPTVPGASSSVQMPTASTTNSPTNMPNSNTSTFNEMVKPQDGISNNQSTNSNNSSHTTNSSSVPKEDTLGKGKGNSSNSNNSNSSNNRDNHNKQDNHKKVEEEFDTSAPEGVLGEASYAELIAKEEKQIRIATGVSVGSMILSAVMSFAGVIQWFVLALLLAAIALFYGTFRHKKKKKIAKLKELIKIEKIKKEEVSESDKNSETQVESQTEKESESNDTSDEKENIIDDKKDNIKEEKIDVKTDSKKDDKVENKDSENKKTEVVKETKNKDEETTEE